MDRPTPPHEGPPTVRDDRPGGPGPERPGSVGPGILTRIVALFHAPSRAFAPPRGTSFWLVPIFLVFLANIVFGVLLHDLLAAWLRDFVATNPDLPDAQRDEMLDALAGRADLGGVRFWIDTTLGSLGSVAFVFFLGGLFYMVGINFGLGGQARYLDSVGVLALTSLVQVARECLTLPIKLSQGTLAVYTSPAAFLEPDRSALFTVLSFLDVFDLFRLVLLAIGFGIVGGVSTKKASAVVLAYWVLWCILRLGWRLSPFGAAAP